MSTQATPQVEFRGVSKRYGDVVALDGFNLTISKGEYVVLLGPSGSGKTTALSLVGGFVEPSSGQIVLGGRDVTALPPNHRECATVFQDYALFPHMTVEGNINFGLTMKKVPRRERKARVMEMLELVGLTGFDDRRIQSMSGGQRQRIALARALATRPSVLLLDEPLGALDMKIRRQMQEELAAIHEHVGTTFIHVTHDQEEAMNIADTVVLLNEGKIEDMGPPENLYRCPRTLFSATFMGDSNIVAGQVIDSDRAGATQLETAFGKVAVSGQATVGDNVRLCIRPENIQIRRTDSSEVQLGKARVDSLQFQGSSVRLHVSAGKGFAQELLVQTPAYHHPNVGDEIELSARLADLIMLSGKDPADPMLT